MANSGLVSSKGGILEGLPQSNVPSEVAGRRLRVSEEKSQQTPYDLVAC